ncbi:5,6-dimethylbenzimidazole synthase [Actibacterium lipolyticum]|uniref:5,6-dimethylbenzimidazole synthase n=1 Tax=Actibacterium lipolyticum TaxID=1524263 RepID=A0A238JW21_9RHOB|nr:5,6-dimethylbenzimidazole synthase [Actibacterium lipolyticum]SMX34868.1 5,6-dimethylbenzimidazole synthase [Actibacterium lipolyticum]
MEFAEQHAELLKDVLRWRRDTRHFRPDPLTDEQLAPLREAMDLAPSVGNARPWRVLRVTDPTLRAKVRAEFERCNAAAAAAYGTQDRAEYMRLKLAGLDVAPEHLAIFTAVDPTAGRGLGRRTMPETLRQSTAMAIYSLWLTARAHNIGVGMVSILDPERVEEIFDTPEGWEFSAYLCVGLPEFKDDTPLLHRAGWQENSETEWETR